MERLIDFYETGFYSLAHLPTRAAWRNRLTEQLAFRTLFLVEDERGRVASAALSSAEGGGAAMLGGVATVAEYRGRGLSVLCVGALCEYLARKGLTTVALFYLKDNAPAGRVYDKLGFLQAGEWLLAPLGLGASLVPLLQPQQF
jgi:predicted GNAT family acetyltransferase